MKAEEQDEAYKRLEAFFCGDPDDDNQKLGDKTYFELHADRLIKHCGLTKTQFCTLMGIKLSNLPKLQKTKNIFLLKKVADVLGYPMDLIVSGQKWEYYEKLLIMGIVRVEDKLYPINTKDDLKKVLKVINSKEKSTQRCI